MPRLPVCCQRSDPNPLGSSFQVNSPSRTTDGGTMSKFIVFLILAVGVFALANHVGIAPSLPISLPGFGGTGVTEEGRNVVFKQKNESKTYKTDIRHCRRYGALSSECARRRPARSGESLALNDSSVRGELLGAGADGFEQVGILSWVSACPAE